MLSECCRDCLKEIFSLEDFDYLKGLNKAEKKILTTSEFSVVERSPFGEISIFNTQFFTIRIRFIGILRVKFGEFCKNILRINPRLGV